MKPLIPLSILLLIKTTAMAQIYKGQFLIGGSISFESVKYQGSNVPEYRTSNFFISPGMGYFIIEKLAGGVRLDIRSYKQSSPNDWRQTNTSISPFLRYYILPSVKKINAFADVSYLSYRSRYSSGTSPGAINRSHGYSISGGPAIFLTEQVSLEFLFGYKRMTVNDGDYLSSTFNSGLGLQIHLGRKKVKTKK